MNDFSIFPCNIHTAGHKRVEKSDVRVVYMSFRRITLTVNLQNGYARAQMSTDVNWRFADRARLFRDEQGKEVTETTTNGNNNQFFDNICINLASFILFLHISSFLLL